MALACASCQRAADDSEPSKTSIDHQWSSMVGRSYACLRLPCHGSICLDGLDLFVTGAPRADRHQAGLDDLEALEHGGQLFGAAQDVGHAAALDQLRGALD